ncbi:MAG: hypothetical protein CMM62_18255 [Rhodospirillaceae bacterium]|nr:hypothetical protein [Rhodospirillaceae bacterium]MAX64426.1 hypothetical protein [Rhodospirillaceae bacterium]MBB58330.1 hypothetical protein [Rhodospirillaceae bacterium]|tara:strand:- start:11239 stop:12444 length:1206 start_codon:yes stop_codon:yes gene_type:complete
MQGRWLSEPTRLFGLSTPVIGILFCLVLTFATLSLLKPKYAWDSTHYIGCILSALQGGTWEEKRERTYSYLSQRYPPDVYRDLTTAGPGISTYREFMSKSAKAFELTQPVYCYKIGFVWPAIALTWMGVDPHWALRLLSAIPAAVLFGMTAVWLCRRMDARIAIPLSLMGMGFMLYQTARYEYPDSLTALALGAAMIAHGKAMPRTTGLLLLAAITVRADAIIFVGAYLGVATFFCQGPRRMPFWQAAVPWGIVSLLLYAGIVAVMNPPGYKAVFSHSLISQTPFLQISEPIVTFEIYLEILIRQLGYLMVDGIKLLIIAPLVLVAYWISRRHTELQIYGEIGAISVAMVALHFIIFPYYDPRYYSAPYLMMVVGGGTVWTTLLADRLTGFSVLKPSIGGA